MRPRMLVALGVALGVALAIGAAGPAAAQNVRIVERMPDPRTDSLVDRIFKANVEEVQRMVAEWRDREGQLVAQLRTLPAEGGDQVARRRLDEGFMQSSREAFAMMRAIQERCVQERGPVPDGYIGVSLDTRVDVVDGRPVPAMVSVSSVEPGGPAQRAGIARNDRLLAIGGRDARSRIPDIGDLLVPGRSLVVKVERDGAPRDFVVNIEPRPRGFAESCGELERALAPLRTRAFTGVIRERTGPGGGAVAVGPRGAASGLEFERMRGEPPEAMRIMFFSSGGNDEAYFAGAKFRALDADWRELLGAKQGVMVFEVAAGSVAARAGLKGGDVVTSVGESPATDPMVFIQLLEVHERAEATLSVLRDKKPRTVTLRWRESQPRSP
jgi:S1-C subfamily serine protease